MLIGVVESLQSQFEIKVTYMCFVKQIASQLAAVWQKNHLCSTSVLHESGICSPQFVVKNAISLFLNFLKGKSIFYCKLLQIPDS